MNAINSEIVKFERHINNTLGGARNLEYFRQQVQTVVNDLGFTHFDYSLVSNKNNFQFLLTTIPESLSNTYSHEKLYKYDWCLENVIREKQAVYLSTIINDTERLSFSSDSKAKNQMIRDLGYDHGFKDCYSIPVTIRNTKEQVLFSVVSKGEEEKRFKEKTVAQRAKLNFLAQSIYLTTDKNFRRNFPYKPLLTERQVEIVETLAKYEYSMAQVADHLHMSVSTVYSHLERIKEALGTTFVHRVIAIAIEKGLIDFK